jgi:hypothetical protein
MTDPDLLDAVRALRLKLRAAKGLIRDLTAASAEVERLLHQAEPKEAEPNERQRIAA